MQMFDITESEQNFLLLDDAVFRNYDVNSFKVNATLKTEGTELPVAKMDASVYMDALDGCHSRILNIFLSPDQCMDFAQKINSPQVISANISVKDIDRDAIAFTTSPEYLVTFANNILASMNRMLNGSFTEAEMNAYLSNDFLVKVKKQVAPHTNIDLSHFDSKGVMNAIGEQPLVKVTPQYASNVLIPFTKSFTAYRKDSMDAINRASTAIATAANTVNRALSVLDKTTVANKSQVNYFVFNSVRNLIEASSFLSFVTMKKANAVIAGYHSFISAYDQVNAIFNPMVQTESVFSATLIPSDTESIASEMVKGDVDAFTELAINILEFHRGMSMNASPDIGGDNFHTAIDNMIDRVEYEKDIYDDTSRIFIQIGEALNIIDRSSNDYLLVFDDIVSRSGLRGGLVDKFQGYIEKITDTTSYSSNLGYDEDAYYRMLHEVKDYSKNMQTLADNMHDTYTQIMDLKNRFENNINGEFENAEAVNELKLFMSEFDDQYKAIINLITSKYMCRLRDIAVKLEEMQVQKNDKREEPLTMTEESVIDFTDGVFESTLDENEIITKMIFESLSDEYFKKSMLNKRGAIVVTEADAPAQPATQPQQAAQPAAQPAQTQEPAKPQATTQTSNAKDGKTSTAPSVTDNSGSGKDTGAIVKSMQEFFTMLINKFEELIGKQGTHNTKWLSVNKDNLGKRSYNNVTASLLPYDKMPIETVISTVDKVATNISNVSKNLNGVKTEQDLYNKIFTFTTIDPNGDLKAQLTQYFKTGKAAPNLQEYSNDSGLKPLVTNIISYCDKYYNNYAKSIENSINKIKDSVTDMTKATVAATADGPSVDEIKGWVSKLSKTFCGCVLNACRDRTNDYFKLLGQLVPKNKPTASETPSKPEEKPDTSTQTDTQAQAGQANA